MTAVKRILWISDNGKYKVLVRHFEGDPSPLMGYWKLNSDNRFVQVGFKSLPAYVLGKIKEMESMVINK